MSKGTNLFLVPTPDLNAGGPVAANGYAAPPKVVMDDQYTVVMDDSNNVPTSGQ